MSFQYFFYWKVLISIYIEYFILFLYKTYNTIYLKVRTDKFKSWSSTISNTLEANFLFNKLSNSRYEKLKKYMQMFISDKNVVSIKHICSIKQNKMSILIAMFFPTVWRSIKITTIFIIYACYAFYFIQYYITVSF